MRACGQPAWRVHSDSSQHVLSSVAARGSRQELFYASPQKGTNLSCEKLTNAKVNFSRSGRDRGSPLSLLLAPSFSLLRTTDSVEPTSRCSLSSGAHCRSRNAAAGVDDQALLFPLEMASTLDTMVLSYGAAVLTTLGFLATNSSTLRAEGDLGLQQAQRRTQHPFFSPSRLCTFLNTKSSNHPSHRKAEVASAPPQS